MIDRFTQTGGSDLADLYPLLPAQSALAFVLSAETWPVFWQWLCKHDGKGTEAFDRADLETAFSKLIEITREYR